jgi:hypothetical protein
MFANKEDNAHFHSQLDLSRKCISTLYELLMCRKDVTTQEKLELSRSFSKIIWNLDDLVWTFDPNKGA